MTKKIASIFIIVLLSISPLSAQEYKNKDKQEKKSEEKAEEVNNKLCPVDFKRLYGLENKPEGGGLASNGQSQKVSYVYEGKLYYFDSAECVEKFKEDPEGYLKEWEKKERFRRLNIIND